MEPRAWYAILESAEVGRQLLGVTRLGHRLVLWRDAAGRIAATSDICPHRGAALSLGEVVDGCIACPFHGFRFAPDGACTSIPAHGDRPPPAGYSVPAFAVREAHGLIYLWNGAAEDAPDELPFFPELQDGWAWAGSETHEDWPVHWSRVIENQLDFLHLPFVHAGSIGKGYPLEIEAHVEPFDGGFRSWVTAPGRPEIKAELAWRAPNLWTLVLGPSARILAFMAPIDDENTRIYLRFYQRWVTAPGLSWLFGKLTIPMNLRILHEDRAVVASQLPRASSLRGGEKLVPGDAPIVAFRRWRDGGLGDRPGLRAVQGA